LSEPSRSALNAYAHRRVRTHTCTHTHHRTHTHARRTFPAGFAVQCFGALDLASKLISRQICKNRFKKSSRLLKSRRKKNQSAPEILENTSPEKIRGKEREKNKTQATTTIVEWLRGCFLFVFFSFLGPGWRIPNLITGLSFFLSWAPKTQLGSLD